MPVDIRLPQIGEAKTEAKLAVWLKREGESVVAGEPIVEVETDKTTVEIEAPASGVLRSIRVTPGTEGLVAGSVLAVIDDAPGETAAPSDPAPDVTSNRPPQPVPAPPVVSAPPSDHTPPVASAPPDQASERSTAPSSRKATPLAARIAKLAGVDLNAIPTVGDARITKSDVEAVIGRAGGSSPMIRSTAGTAASSQVSSTLSTTGLPAFEDRPLTAIRRVTASRLQGAKQTVPHFYLRADCRVDQLSAMRSRLNARASGVKITFTDLIVLAVTQALTKVPLANASWMDSGLRVYRSVDIAVAVNTPKGLMTPIVRECQTKSLAKISQELAALAERARAGTLKPEEYTGGTFTVSNLGMFGVTSITPIINPPQACILGVGAIEDRAVVDHGSVVAGRMMSCTLAADHRAIDGATGAEMLAEVRRLLEDPVALALQL